ncbi:MAG: COG1361 S-layer family protein [Acutalibacteraceae bacterium]
MKRFLVLILCIILCSFTCFAGEKTDNKTEKTTEKVTETVVEKEDAVEYVPEDNSQPRLMVTGYVVENDYLTPEKDGKITVTLKNMHSKKAVKNIKLSVGDETDEIRPDGMGTKYISSIGAEKTYQWEIDVKVIYSATVGEHRLNFVCEYEDSYGGGYSANDILRVEVRQPAELTFDGAKLPVKVVQDDTVSINVNLMNTGKATLYNCKVDFDIEGLESGGSSFTGEIPVGESTSVSANLQVDSNKTGEVKGTIKITYEDYFGNEFEQTQEVKTVIEKKVVKAQKVEEEEKPQNPLWWLFLAGGFVAGGGLGFGIPFAINAKKQRDEDEKRL